jgi:ubiquinone/menaquinone biosynthesis C-methylase UbiE
MDAGEDHVASARAIYDMTAPRYVQFVGTEISSATEGPIDQSLLVAFVELVKRQSVARVVDVGCGPGRAAAFMAERSLDVVGVDISPAMLTVAKSAHPHIRFEEGQLDALPFEAGVFAGAVCWYSIIYTPPDRLAEAFGELARVLMPGGYVLLAFQAEDEPLRRTNAHGTHLPLTSYRHSVQDVADRLEDIGFKIFTTVLRAPDLENETTFQGFVIASSATS